MTTRRAAVASALAGVALAGLALLASTAPRADSEPGPATAIRASKFELFVHDPAESLRFYEALGFALVRQKTDGYTIVASGDTVIALSPLPGWLPVHWLGFLRRPPLGTEIVLYTDQLEALRNSVGEADGDPGPIELQPWGDRDFRVTDPDGYYVRVSEGTNT